MDNLKELKELLISEKSTDLTFKYRAKKLLSGLSLKEFAQIEQKMLDDGVSSERVRKLCPAHLEIAEEKLKDNLSKMKPDHPVKILMLDHQKIIKSLDDLEEFNNHVQNLKSKRKFKKAEIKKFNNIAKQFTLITKHHKLEERVLFPLLQEKGIKSTVLIMRREHCELNNLQAKLLALSKTTKDIANFKTFQDEIDLVSELLELTLRDHVFKEDMILFQTAVELIPSISVWQKLHLRGYLT